MGSQQHLATGPRPTPQTQLLPAPQDRFSPQISSFSPAVSLRQQRGCLKLPGGVLQLPSPLSSCTPSCWPFTRGTASVTSPGVSVPRHSTAGGSQDSFQKELLLGQQSEVSPGDRGTRSRCRHSTNPRRGWRRANCRVRQGTSTSQGGLEARLPPSGGRPPRNAGRQHRAALASAGSI